MQAQSHILPCQPIVISLKEECCLTSLGGSIASKAWKDNVVRGSKECRCGCVLELELASACVYTIPIAHSCVILYKCIIMPLKTDYKY